MKMNIYEFMKLYMNMKYMKLHEYMNMKLYELDHYENKIIYEYELNMKLHNF